MNILLLDPPGLEGIPVGRLNGSFGTSKADQAWPPYDLQILSGFFQREGHQTIILDANNLRLTPTQALEQIVRANPDWLIVLTCFQTFDIDLEVVAAAKHALPHVRTAMISLAMQSVTNLERRFQEAGCLDFLPVGDHEAALFPLFRGVPPQQIPGLYYRNNGQVHFSGGQAILHNLDEIGIPDHASLPAELYRCPLARRLPMAIVNASRGCRNRCSHCQAGTFQRPLRYRSVQQVMEELTFLHARGYREIKFFDCSLPADRNFALRLTAEMIRRGFGFSWHCNARADHLDDEVLAAMKQAGCHTISLGCESADPLVLARLGKNLSPPTIARAVRAIQAHKMRVLLYAVFGLEGETPTTMERTYRFIARLRPDFATFGIVVPAPGTPFFERLQHSGWLEGTTGDPNRLPTFRYPGLMPEEILDFARQAYRRYYLRLGYLARKLLKIRTREEFLSLFSNGWEVVKNFVLPLNKGRP